MSTINIDKREVSKTNRNGRIDSTSNSATATSSTVGGGGTVIDWAEVTPEKVTINRDLAVTGTITASEDVIAYVAGEVTPDVLAALSVTAPLEKVGTNISFQYNPTQFEIVSNQLSIKAGSTGSTEWTAITGKPTFAAVATSGSYTDLTNLPTITSTIAGATDKASYFTGTKALTAAVADSANSVSWYNISSKPTYFTPDSHTQDWTTITGKPSTFTPSTHYHNITSSPDYSSFFSGTSALNSLSLGGTVASAFYNSNNFNKSTVPIATSTLTAATSIVVNGWTISISAGSLIFNNGTNRCKVDANGNLTASGEITAYGTV